MFFRMKLPRPGRPFVFSARNPELPLVVKDCVFSGEMCSIFTAGCWKPFCPVKFHLPCSLGREVVNRHDIFMSSCWAHSRPQEDLPGDHQCGVCGWAVERGLSFSSLATSCCGNKHHRDCIQVSVEPGALQRLQYSAVRTLQAIAGDWQYNTRPSLSTDPWPTFLTQIKQIDFHVSGSGQSRQWDLSLLW